jgi:hypothetical protein
MEIIGQSTYTAKVPYLHLGYVAATTFTKTGLALFGGGATSIVLGFVVLLGVVSKRLRLRSAKTGACFSRRFNLIAGVALLVAGYTCLHAALNADYLVPQHPEMQTRVNAQLFIERLSETAATQPIGENTGREDPLLIDAWGRRMRVEKAPSGAPTHHAIRSAGPDGEFGNDDDIVTIARQRQ